MRNENGRYIVGLSIEPSRTYLLVCGSCRCRLLFLPAVRAAELCHKSRGQIKRFVFRLIPNDHDGKQKMPPSSVLNGASSAKYLFELARISFVEIGTISFLDQYDNE